MVGKIADPLCGHEYHVLFVSSAAVSDMERLSVFPVRTGDWDPDARAVYHDSLEGFTTVIMLQLITSSILMIAVGIIGYYIAKIYDEVKDRPRYIVEEETGENKTDE